MAAEGLINDAREHIREIEAGPALDAVLIAALQKTEHYCIAAWGTAKALGAAVEQKSAVRAIERALREGGKYDERLTALTEKEITPSLLERADEPTMENQSGDQGRQENGRGRRAST